MRPSRPIFTLLLSFALNGTLTQAAPDNESPTPSRSGAVLGWGVKNSALKSLPLEVLSDVVAVAASTDSSGFSSNLALKADRTTVAWRSYDFARSTVPVQAQSEIIAVAAGSIHLAALRSDGKVITWSDTNFLLPVPDEAQPDIIAIAAGGSWTLALKSNGAVLSWDAFNGNSLTVPAEAQGDVRVIAAGLHHSMALKTDGSVVAWGQNSYGQSTVPVEAQSGVVAIACGTGHSVALKQDGSVVAWGSDIYGQATVPAEAKSGVVAIAAGYFTLALKVDGSVVSWGGVPSFNPPGLEIPTVPTEAKSGVIAISLLESLALAVVVPSAPRILTAPQSLTVNQGQSLRLTVSNSGYPLDFQWRKDGVDIPGATDNAFSLKYALTEDAGEYSVVVRNQAGSVTSSPPARLTVRPEPGWAVVWPEGASGGVTEVPAIAQGGLIQIAAGVYHVVGLKADGSVVVWGGASTDPAVSLGLTVIPAEARTGVSAVAAGLYHSLALKLDGTVIAWGADDTQNYGHLAVPGSARNGVSSISAGPFFNLALKMDGSVITWGDNRYGQTNVPAAAQSGIQAIASGSTHALALTTKGEVIAWGSNSRGESSVPAGAQSGVIAIAAGSRTSMALKTDRSIVAWGDNLFGQTTIPLATQPGVIAIAAGGDHCAAIRSDGFIVVWGRLPWDPGGCCLSSVPLVAQREPVGIAVGANFIVALEGAVNTLHAQSAGEELTMTWPRNTTAGLTLQSTSDLTSPTVWNDVGEIPRFSGVQYVLRVGRSDKARWYRLH